MKRVLYSVWNTTNTTTTATLLSGGEALNGSCSYCPEGHTTLDYNSDIMCESIPGWTTQDQGSDAGSAVVLLFGLSFISIFVFI